MKTLDTMPTNAAAPEVQAPLCRDCLTWPAPGNVDACPRCGSPVQRIVYAENEANYCAPCQPEGKLLADRAL